VEPHEPLLEFWFGDATASPERAVARNAVWFARDDAFDAECRTRFAPLLERAAAGELDRWRGAARSTLALVLLFDQVPRNAFRGTPRAFAYDDRALAAARAGVALGFDAHLHPVEAAFLYLPFEHAEDRAMQERGVAAFEALLARTPAGFQPIIAEYADYARRHCAVVRRFGRFPHRNALLGRPATPDEEAYLRGGGETFGG